MTDLRQGVTATQHTVLDLIEQHAAEWSDGRDISEQLRMAYARAGNAYRAAKLQDQHRYAVEAAARLIDAADVIDRLLAAGDA